MRLMYETSYRVSPYAKRIPHLFHLQRRHACAIAICSGLNRRADSAACGWYFVTICPQKHAPYSGAIHATESTASVLGQIAERCWPEISHHFPRVQLAVFQLMPNHLHGIVFLQWSVETGHALSPSTAPVTIQPGQAPYALNLCIVHAVFPWRASVGKGGVPP